VIGLLSGCGHAHSNDALDVASLNLTCTPTSHGMHCRLLALSHDVSRMPRDVTSDASWWLSEGAGARISPGGIIDATAGGDVEVEAQYRSHRVHAQMRLRSDGPGQILAALRGRIYVGINGTLRPVAYARVEVIGGPSAGLSTKTLGDGSYELLGIVPGDVVIRATAPGYSGVDGSTQVFAGDNRFSLLIQLVRLTVGTAL
jgi:hypothetical protein